MSRPGAKYPSVPLIPGEIVTLIEELKSQYGQVDIYASESPPGAPRQLLFANVRCRYPKNLLLEPELRSSCGWGVGHYNSYEGALFSALWFAIDRCIGWIDMLDR